MKRRRYRYTQEEKNQFIEEYKGSNLTKFQYCEEKGLSFTAFKQWKYVPLNEFIPVQVVKSVEGSGRLISPGGYQVEAPLSVILELWKELP